MNKLNKKYSPRERWNAVFEGGSSEGMVSPLCDNWCFHDVEYYWPFDEPDPYPVGYKHHYLSRQMAMGGICGWDSTFLDSIHFLPTDKAPVWTSKTYKESNNPNTFTETRIETPYGDLSNIAENSPVSRRNVKEWLTTKEDYQKLIWYFDHALEIDIDAAIKEGKMLRAAVGEKGLLGTWIPPAYNQFSNTEEMFFHCIDWKDEYEAFLDASLRNILNRLDIYAKADFDYIFFMIPGTEWNSPDFFERYVRTSSKKIADTWRSYDKKIMIHSCGHMKLFIEKGYINELKPDIFETLSEPPVGNLPSLRWAREKVDASIVTKGNIGLDILLEGSEYDIREAVNRVKEQTRGTLHVVGTSDNLLPGTPLKNCLAFTEESRKGNNI